MSYFADEDVGLKTRRINFLFF